MGLRLQGIGAATGAGLLYALNLQSAAATLQILSETMFTTLVVTALWVEIDDVGHPWVRALGLGVLLGFATLCRPVGVFVPFCFLCCWLIRGRGAGWRLQMVAAMLLLVGVAGVLSPWLVRNARVYGDARLSTIGTYNLLYFNAASLVAEQHGESLEAAAGRLWAEVKRRTNGQPRNSIWVQTEEALATEILRAKPWRYARIHLRATLNTLMPDTNVLILLGLSPGPEGMLELVRKEGIVTVGQEYLRRTPGATLYLVISALVLGGTVAAATAGLIAVSRHVGIAYALLLLSLIAGLLLVAGPAAVPRFRAPCLARRMLACRCWRRLGVGDYQGLPGTSFAA